MSKKVAFENGYAAAEKDHPKPRVELHTLGFITGFIPFVGPLTAMVIGSAVPVQVPATHLDNYNKDYQKEFKRGYSSSRKRHRIQAMFFAGMLSSAILVCVFYSLGPPFNAPGN